MDDAVAGPLRNKLLKKGMAPEAVDEVFEELT